MLPGVAVAQVQDSALGPIELHPVGFSSLIQPVQIALKDLPNPRQMNISSQIDITCRLSVDALNPLVWVIIKDIKQ